MKVAERATPVAAVVAAVTTLACCLPLSIAGAAGLASVAAWAGAYRAWFLVLATLLLAAGFLQLYLRRGKQCQRRSRVSVAVFWISAVLVLLILLFPQVIATLLAG